VGEREREEPLVHVDVGLLADDVGEAAADTFDGGESEHYLLLSVHVRIEDTQYVLELLIGHQRLRFPPTTRHIKNPNPNPNPNPHTHMHIQN
jgi:hypothetical protein